MHAMTVAMSSMPGGGGGSPGGNAGVLAEADRAMPVLGRGLSGGLIAAGAAQGCRIGDEVARGRLVGEVESPDALRPVHEAAHALSLAQILDGRAAADTERPSGRPSRSKTKTRGITAEREGCGLLQTIRQSSERQVANGGGCLRYG